MLQNATCLRKSAPGPPNSSDEHVSCIAPATEKCIFADPLQMSHACHRFWTCHQTLTFCLLLTRCTIPCACHAKRHLKVQKCSEPVSFLHFWLRNVLRATTPCTFSTSQLPNVRCLAFSLANVLPATVWISSTSQLPKVLRTWGAFSFFTCKCASTRFDCVHFFDILTSKIVPNLKFFSFFTCKCVLRTWCALYMLTWTCALPHNGVHFFDSSTSKSGPNLVCFVHFDLEMCFAPQRRAIFHLSPGQLAPHPPLCRFSEPIFRPSGATNHGRNTYTFSRTWIFFLLRLSLFLSSFFSSLLSLSVFPSLLFICPYCRKFDF